VDGKPKDRGSSTGTRNENPQQHIRKEEKCGSRQQHTFCPNLKEYRVAGGRTGMSLKKVGMQAIEGLVQIEETLFGIYRLFAERFPAYRDMWSRMAEEEEVHAKWIRDLYGKVEQGSVRLGREETT